MRLILIIVSLLLTVFLITCREGIVETPDDSDFFKAGQVEDALYYSDFAQPDSILINQIHRHSNPVDIDNDGIIEFDIISNEERVTVTDYNQNEREYYVKTLYLSKRKENVQVSVESIDITNYVGIISKNTSLSFDHQVWNTLDSVKIFCQWERNIDAGFSYDFGIWNNQSNKYFAVNFQHEGKTIIGWVEISILEYDNYILHNFASFNLE